MNERGRTLGILVAAVCLSTAILGIQAKICLATNISVPEELPKTATKTVVEIKPAELKQMSEISLAGVPSYAFGNYEIEGDSCVTSQGGIRISSMVVEAERYSPTKLLNAFIDDGKFMLNFGLSEEKQEILGLQVIQTCVNDNRYTAILKYNDIDELGNYLPRLQIYQVVCLDDTHYLETSCHNMNITQYNKEEFEYLLRDICNAFMLTIPVETLVHIADTSAETDVFGVDVNNTSLYTSEKFFAFDTQTGTITEYLSRNKDAPDVVVIPPTISGVTVRAIGDKAFYRYSTATEITSIVIPDSVTEIGDNAFMSNALLEKVQMPTSLISIGEGAFQGCVSLREIEIRGNVRVISSKAFKNCDTLEKVLLSEATTTIEKSAFEGCRMLTTVNNTEAVSTIDDKAFKGTRIAKSVFEGNEGITISNNSFDYKEKEDN